MIFQQRAVEIIVSGAEEDERDELACMVDYLRRMVVTFEKHTQLPLPMHMVRSIKKYIAQDDVYIQQDDWEDDIILEEDGQLAVVF
ncbi:RNaseH domain-containing protein [Bacillus cereus]